MDITEVSKPRKYDIDLLNTIIERDESKLIGDYESLNVYSIINFQCKCGKEGSKKFRTLYNKSGASCEACAKINGRKKSEATNLQLFGVTNPFMSKDIQEKIKSEYKTRSEEKKKEIKDKMKQTIYSRSEEEKKQIIEKRKETHYSKSEEEKKQIIEKRKETNSSKSEEEKKQIIEKRNETNSSKSEEEKKQIIEKQKASCIIKYGVDNSLKSQKVKDKIKETNFNKYGVDNPFKSQEVKDTIKETNFNKYGVDNPFKSQEVKDKIKETNINKYGTEYHTQSLTKEEWNRRMKKRVGTNLERFGYENPAQHPEIFEKIQESAKRFKPYTMPSGEIRKIQGYEGFALDELVKIYREDQIKTNRKDVGRIQYVLDGKIKYYSPDIGIPHENKLIEVKSNYTYTIDPEKIKCKGEACKSLGIDYEIWIYTQKGEKEVIKF